MVFLTEKEKNIKLIRGGYNYCMIYKKFLIIQELLKLNSTNMMKLTSYFFRVFWEEPLRR